LPGSQNWPKSQLELDDGKKTPEEWFSLSEITAGLTGEAAAVSASDLATPCAAHALLHDLLPDLVGVFCVSRKKDLRPDHS